MSLFCSTALAERIERAECSLIRDGAAAVERRHAEADVCTVELAGGIAAYTIYGSPLNKIAGLGFDAEQRQLPLAHCSGGQKTREFRHSRIDVTRSFSV